jgi:hypothetical protein
LELREQQADQLNAYNGGGSNGGNGNGIGNGSGSSALHHAKLGRNLAVGQFDLASTFHTERPHIGESDLHPDVAKGRAASSSQSQSMTGAAEASRGPPSIVEKINRHWAMVLHPEDAKAGTMDWVSVAKHSVKHAVPKDKTANAGGGYDDEFTKLVGYADCDEAFADHIRNTGNANNEFESLELSNVAAYSGNGLGNISSSTAALSLSEAQLNTAMMRELQKRVVYSRAVEDHCKRLIQGCFKLKSECTSDVLSTTSNSSSGGVSLLSKTSTPKYLPPSTIPTPDIGIRLMQALSKKMGDSNKTDADAQKIASQLPNDFKRQLDSFFRRSSELLRHFFGLRRVISAQEEANYHKHRKSSKSTTNNNTNDNSTGSGGGGGFAPVSSFAPVGGVGVGQHQKADDAAAAKADSEEPTSDEESKKLERIFDGMKTLYEEMETMRKNLPQTPQGEQMRRMCKPIMDQLDLAFQLHHRGGSHTTTMFTSATRTGSAASGSNNGGFAPVNGFAPVKTGGGFAPVAKTGGFAPVNLAS